MNNESYYGVTRTNEYLAHYGIKGMKWGVRKARESGNSKALGRQYRKAQKKLAKLEARANNGKKYAKRAAALAAGAGAAGGLAGFGTAGVSKVMGLGGGAVAGGATHLGGLMAKSKNGKVRLAGNAMQKFGTKAGITIGKANRAVTDWGNAKSGIQTRAGRALQRQGQANIDNAVKAASRGHLSSNDLLRAGGVGKTEVAKGRGMQYTNNQLLRAGAAALGAGLAGGAAYNAYRAATTKRAARKAAQFRSEMNKAFAGTQYDRRRKKNRRG